MQEYERKGGNVEVIVRFQMRDQGGFDWGQ